MKKASTIAMIVNIVLTVVLLTGYVKNIIKLTKCDFEPNYKAEIIYGLGAVTGLGVITGYMDFGK